MTWLKKTFKFLLVAGLAGTVLAIATAYGVYIYLKPSLPSIDSLKDVQLQVPLRIYSKDGKLISEYGEKRRIPKTFEQIPTDMIQAFLAAEDDRFYEHPGVDYQGLIRAAIQLALTGQKKQGGSTITMQVARNFFLSSKKTYLRKLNEILLALKIDNELSKNDVLTLYLNKIYLGHRAYGVGAAARVYYGKELEELTLAETAMIAGLPKAPSKYNPITNPQRSTLRRNYVIGRMLELGYINAAEAELARNAPVTAKRHAANIELNAPYIAELARAEIYARFGDNSYTGGYSVITTVDSALQEQAISAVRMVCDNYDKRHGYRGPIANHAELNGMLADLDKLIEKTPVIAELQPAYVQAVNEKSVQIYLGNAQSSEIPWAGLEWARAFISEDRKGPKLKTAADVLKAGDLIYILPEVDNSADQPVQFWRLAQVPAVNSSLVSVDSHTGAIQSLVGGYDYYETKFNRVTQAKRQPGSGFKAFIYSAALEQGFTAASLINDAPVVFEDKGLETAWRPENYSGKFFGPTRLRYALTKSRNLVSIRLVRSIGIQAALNHAALFGFDIKELPHNLSIALGSANVTPMQMVRGYSVLSNGGYLIDPYLIESITDGNGDEIYKADPAIVCEDCEAAAISQNPAVSLTPAEDNTTQAEPVESIKPQLAPRVISTENRYIMYSMMQDVITRGTATRAKVLKRVDLAGKTGTTNDQRDAWFNGYNQSIATTVWVGFDDNSKLGRKEFGGSAALPGWIHYMRKALEYDPQDNPPIMPDGMVSIRIDPETGKLAAIGQKNAIFEVFRENNVPTERAQAEIIIPPSGNAGSSNNNSAPPASVTEGLF